MIPQLLRAIGIQSRAPQTALTAAASTAADAHRRDQITVSVKSGDIGLVPADALITPINSAGMWYGALDGVIQRYGGNQFHDQAAQRLENPGLGDCDTVVARAAQPHAGAFKDVVFVVDDARKPLREVIKAGLSAANAAGYAAVSLPMMRMGLAMGVYEKTPQATIAEMAAGIQEFAQQNPHGNVRDISFVVYHDQPSEAMLWNAFGGNQLTAGSTAVLSHHPSPTPALGRPA